MKFNMGNDRKLEIKLDVKRMYASLMSEYALMSAGKSEDEMPMQYARCEMPAICEVLFMEEIGTMCSRIGGYVDDCNEDSDGLVSLKMRLPVDLPTEADSMLRRGMERYLVAAVLGRCLVPVRVSQAEYSAVVQRSRCAMRSLRQILAKVATA